MGIKKIPKFILQWNWCKRCSCHIAGDMFDMRVHLAQDHKIEKAWTMLDEDIKDEYNFEIEVRDHRLRSLSCLE